MPRAGTNRAPPSSTARRRSCGRPRQKYVDAYETLDRPRLSPGNDQCFATSPRAKSHGPGPMTANRRGVSPRGSCSTMQLVNPRGSSAGRGDNGRGKRQTLETDIIKVDLPGRTTASRRGGADHAPRLINNDAKLERTPGGRPSPARGGTIDLAGSINYQDGYSPGARKRGQSARENGPARGGSGRSRKVLLARVRDRRLRLCFAELGGISAPPPPARRSTSRCADASLVYHA